MEQPPMSGNYTLMDVHGAGAQRSDPKVGDPANWPHGHGPQGDVIRIYNYVRLVRDAGGATGYEEINIKDKEIKIYPNPVTDMINIAMDEETSGTINIYNSFGQLLSSEDFESSGDLHLNACSLPPGIYILRIVSSSEMRTARFIKN